MSGSIELLADTFQESSNQESQKSSIENYTGVSIQVSSCFEVTFLTSPGLVQLKE